MSVCRFCVLHTAWNIFPYKGCRDCPPFEALNGGSDDWSRAGEMGNIRKHLMNDYEIAANAIRLKEYAQSSDIGEIKVLWTLFS